MSDPQMRTLVEESEALAAERGVQPLRLTLTGKRKNTLYAAPRLEERDDRVFPHMWVHRLRIRRSKPGLFVLKETWDTLPEASATETIVHEWPAVNDWIGLNPPLSFERKQSLLAEASARDQKEYEIERLHALKAEVWPDEEVRYYFDSWKSIRDAEHHDMIFMKREPKWVVNPATGRCIGYVFAFQADAGRARVAAINIELDMATAVFNYAAGELQERVVEEYASAYELDEQAERREELRRSNLGFYMWYRGWDDEGVRRGTYLRGPPLRQEEFRLSLQNLAESFRTSRVENRQPDAPETEVAVYIYPAVLEILLGGAFGYEPGKIPKINDGD
jgi:hypothetical protein